MKVLVVDEVGYTCYVHTRLLEELGYQVICASSGFEALSILEMDSEIKIMFSELVMRELDGLELFRNGIMTTGNWIHPCSSC